MEALKNNSQAIVRALTVAVAVVLQAITMVLVGRYLHEYASWAYVLLEIISFLLVFGLINDQESYRQFWCVIVLVFPVTGLFLYYMWGQRRRNSKTHILIRETEAKMRQYVPHQPEVMEELQELHPYKVQIARFLGSEGFNMYRHTDVKYFPLGEEMLDAMIEDLKKAEKCIFLEYFIISDGVIWKRVKEVLIEKAKAGIDIRLLTLAAWESTPQNFVMSLSSPVFDWRCLPLSIKMLTDCPLTTETIRRLQLLTATSAIAAVLIWRMNMPILSSVLDTGRIRRFVWRVKVCGG